MRPQRDTQGFWARRKAGVAAEAQEETRAQEAAEAEAREAALADKTDAELLADLDLPDPDTLEQGDDFTRFLTEAVPARIKARALRRLWISNPVLANVDGLLDYGEDFTDAAMAVENIQTAYQVGKGMTAHVDELARQADEAAKEATAADLTDADNDAEAPEPETETASDTSASSVRPPEALTAIEPSASVTPEATQALTETEDDSDQLAAPIRRMRFSFAEDEA